jgi:predicted Zn-dependent peptidase
VKFGIEKISKKLERWYLLDFASLLSEFKKVKVSLDFNSEEKLMVYFEEKKNLVYNLKTQIDQTDKEIDLMVYELYGLTQEEIQIVENS